MRAILLVLISLSTEALAQAPMQPSFASRLQAVAERQIAQHPSLAGRRHAVRWEPLVELKRCPIATRVAVNPRERLWGQVSVTLTCAAERGGWTRQMRGYVAIPGTYWRSTVAIGAGTEFRSSDWVKDEIDLSSLSEGALAGLVESPQSLVGWQSARALAVGRPLVLTDWRKMTVIERGATVRVAIQGSGFDISAMGVTLDEGAVGDRVRVKTSEGKTLEGVAQADGSVVVRLN